MSLFQDITTDELAILSLVLAVLVSKRINLQDLNILGNFIVATGSIMLTIAAQEEALKKQEAPEQDVQKQIKDLQQQIQALQDKHEGQS